MKSSNAEDIIALATMFTVCLTQGKNAKELCSFRTFFNVVSSNLNAIISEKSNKK